MKKDTRSLASQVTEESTIKSVAVYLADHLIENNFIFDGSEKKRPSNQFRCDSFLDKIRCNRSILVLIFQYLINGANILFSSAYQAFDKNNSLPTWKIANLST